MSAGGERHCLSVSAVESSMRTSRLPQDALQQLLVLTLQKQKMTWKINGLSHELHSGGGHRGYAPCNPVLWALLAMFQMRRRGDRYQLRHSDKFTAYLFRVTDYQEIGDWVRKLSLWHWGLSRHQIKRALKVLRDNNLIESFHGRRDDGRGAAFIRLNVEVFWARLGLEVPPATGEALQELGPCSSGSAAPQATPGGPSIAQVPPNNQEAHAQ